MPEDEGGNHLDADGVAAGRLVADVESTGDVVERAQTCRTFPSSFKAHPVRASSLFKMASV
jgi:hypothetical protein